MVGGPRRVPRRAVVQSAAAPGLRGAAGDRAGRPALPGVGGGTTVPRLLPGPGPAGRSGRARAPDRGLGRGAATVPSRDARQVARGPTADPVRGRVVGATRSRVPRAQRARRAARVASGVPGRDVRPGSPHRADVRRAARDARQRGDPRRSRTPPDLHCRAGRRRRLVPLPRGAPRAPRPDPGRGAGRGGRPRAACPGGGLARSGRRDGRGAGRVLPGRGLGRRPTAARRAGRAPGRRGDDVDRFAPARGRAARPVAHARRGSRGARGGSMAGGAGGVRTRGDGIRGVRRRARPATGALRTRGVARSRSHPAHRLVGSDASGARP